MFKNNKYEYINKVYNIKSINDDNIVVRYNNNIEYIYIFEIEPIHILNLNNLDKLNIIEKYTEFLRGFNYDFEIYISSTKLNINDYLNSILIGDDDIDNDLKTMYKNELKNIILNDTIYNTNYYIIVILDTDNYDEIYSNIKNIEKTTCIVNAIKGKKRIEKLLYSSLNKVIS